MKKQILWIYLMLCMGIITTSCSSDFENPVLSDSGEVLINLSTDSEFKSRAVNEEEYKDASKYTVQILKDGRVLDGMEWQYSALPEMPIKLSNGGYELKAFYGENKAASTTSMYVEGSKVFNIEGNQINVSVTCKPVCARVRVQFDEKMAEHYSDYSVSFHTKALVSEGDVDSKFIWTKANTDPVYLKVEKEENVKAVIHLTDKKGKATEINKNYTLSPSQALLMKIVPTIQSGNLGITIEIDESTNDKPIDIEIPSDWI